MTEQKMLVPMSAEEKTDMALDLANTNLKLADVKGEKKDANRGFNDQIKNLNGHALELAAELKSAGRN